MFATSAEAARPVKKQRPPPVKLTALNTRESYVLRPARSGRFSPKDLRGWMRPLSFVVLGCVAISLGALIFGGLGTLSPAISLVILVASALLILVDFNYTRRHATEDDVVASATG